MISKTTIQELLKLEENKVLKDFEKEIDSKLRERYTEKNYVTVIIPHVIIQKDFSLENLISKYRNNGWDVEKDFFMLIFR